MNLTKVARCHIRMDSKWVYFSAVCMGLSVFIRTVYYFGLINLRDSGGFDLIMKVVLPMIIAAGYLVILKGLRWNSPILLGALISVYALNYLVLMNKDAAGVIGGVLLVAAAGTFTATGLGFVPTRIPVLATAGVLAAFRFLVIDLAGYMLPLSMFQPVAYLPEASNLFGFFAVALIGPALHVTVLPSADSASQQTDQAEEKVIVSVN